MRASLRARGLPTPVVTTGKIRTPEFAEQILREERAEDRMRLVRRGLMVPTDAVAVQ